MDIHTIGPWDECEELGLPFRVILLHTYDVVIYTFLG